MRVIPAGIPDVAQLRTLAVGALRHVAAQIRQGGCPVAVAPAPPVPTEGWSHWHPWPELFIQVRGTSRFDTPHGDLHLRAGHALLMPPLFAHNEFLGVPLTGFCNLVFHVRDRELNYHVALPARDSGGRPRVLQPDSITVTDQQLGLASLLGLARAHGPAAEDARCGWMLAFCTWAIAIIESAPPAGYSGSERVCRTRELVTARLGSPGLSVAQLGTWVGCHPDHLARLFRKETGETIVGHIRRVRLERARELLADPVLRVADVARLVGLPDPAYFSRVYRQVHGVPPMVARRAIPAA